MSWMPVYHRRPVPVRDRAGHGTAGASPARQQPQSRQDQGFSRANFTIDWETENAVCPGGQRSFEWWGQKHHRNGTPLLKVFFFAEHCRTCPKKTSCTKPSSGRRGRGITFLAP